MPENCLEVIYRNLRNIFLRFQYTIRDWPLLIKSASVLSMVILLFFLQPILELNLTPGVFQIRGLSLRMQGFRE